MKTLAILLSAYNNEEIIESCVMSSLKQMGANINVVVADDGSTDSTPTILKRISDRYSNFHPIFLPHGERGIARKKALERAKELAPDYIYIIDSDMILEEDLCEKCISYLMKNPQIGSLVIPERAFTDHDNFFSKVKVFERNVVNRAGRFLGKTSIEAARFWRTEEYEKSGGINFNQIAFEETQPTIRYLEQGGIIERAEFTGVAHNEKRVTLKNILQKKRYYFSVMDKTIESEEGGFMKAVRRWYFFRGVLYRGENLIEYIKHPILTLGMIYMYLALTIVWIQELMKNNAKKEKIN